ncbi:MAG TPA: alpha/beta hydrolase, partial [Roseiflexaceae bacterium]|nr:alpha/beta hydrolase [Roseiflexaceae bacterium]
TLVGHSMGTLIAQQVALMASERLERLVLVGATACLRAEVDELQQAVAALEDPVPPAFAREFQLSTTYRPLPGEFLDQVVAESMKLPARVWQAVMAGMLAVDYSDQLSSIRVPTLIVWGDQDTIFDRAHQDALLAGLPDASLKTYPATGHALHWERPAQFARDLAAFAKGA